MPLFRFLVDVPLTHEYEVEAETAVQAWDKLLHNEDLIFSGENEGDPDFRNATNITEGDYEII